MFREIYVPISEDKIDEKIESDGIEKKHQEDHSQSNETAVESVQEELY